MSLQEQPVGCAERPTNA